MSRIRTNQITNQSADGAPTVQNGLVISGVTTSTIFSGSGASLTVSGTTTNDGEILVTGGSAANPATLTLNGNLTNDAPLTINDGQRLIMGTNASVTASVQITIKSDSIKKRIDDLRFTIQEKEKDRRDTSKELKEVMRLQKELIDYRS